MQARSTVVVATPWSLGRVPVTAPAKREVLGTRRTDWARACVSRQAGSAHQDSRTHPHESTNAKSALQPFHHPLR